MSKLDRTKKSFGVNGIIASALISLYWLFVFNFDPYEYALVSALYELLWLPMLVLLYALPIGSLIFWILDRFSRTSLHLYAMIPLILILIYIHIIQ